MNALLQHIHLLGSNESNYVILLYMASVLKKGVF